MSNDSNFQRFLEVLNEVERERLRGRKLETIEEEECKETSEKETHKPEGISKSHSSKPRQKSSRLMLRKPGFVYRTKDLSKATFLDNNLWECTSGRRIFKAPSFKYRQKRKQNLSPYSSRIFEGFHKLTLQQNEPIPSSSKPAINSAKMPKFDPDKSPKFLPLSKCAEFESKRKRTTFPKLIKTPIKPGKFCHNSMKSTSGKSCNKCAISHKKSSTPLSWSTGVRSTSFRELSSYKGDSETSSLLHYHEGWREASPQILTVSSVRSHQTDHILPEILHNATAYRPSPDTPPEEPTSAVRPFPGVERSCSFQARMCEDISVDELSLYMEDFLVLPQKMSSMAEMMYT